MQIRAEVFNGECQLCHARDLWAVRYGDGYRRCLRCGHREPIALFYDLSVEEQAWAMRTMMRYKQRGNDEKI